MKSFVIAATALFALALPPAAAAEGAWWVSGSYAVRSGALDLTTPAGRKAYLAHVERAAMAVCRNEDTRSARARCASETIAAAMEGEDKGATQGGVEALRLAVRERDGAGIQAAQSGAQ